MNWLRMLSIDGFGPDAVGRTPNLLDDGGPFKRPVIFGPEPAGRAHRFGMEFIV